MEMYCTPWLYIYCWQTSNKWANIHANYKPRPRLMEHRDGKQKQNNKQTTYKRAVSLVLHDPRASTHSHTHTHESPKWNERRKKENETHQRSLCERKCEPKRGNQILNVLLNNNRNEKFESPTITLGGGEVSVRSAINSIKYYWWQCVCLSVCA